MGLNLSNIRIGFACKERWDDMVGDAQVRDCAKCNRAVFNLSEMTTEEAEAVLARRGVKPCVRFYRRPDGTVMTSDNCATGVRSERRRLAVVASTFAGTALAASPVMADPATADPATDPATDAASDPTVIRVEMGGISEPIMGELLEVREDHPALEWSAWARLGFGMAAHRPTLLARSTHPPIGEADTIWEGALGGDLTLGVADQGNLRAGVWGELRTTSGPVIGGELVLEGLPPRPWDSDIHGTGAIVVRAGGNEHVATWAVGFGYVGSFPRDDPWISWARHQVGVRVIASTTYSLDTSHDWSATLGLELDPIGAVTAVVHALR